MAAKGGGCSAAGLDDISEPDYDHLNFYFEEEQEEEDHHPKKPGKNGKASKRTPQEPSDPPYILGTLIVRVVAARDLQPARSAHNGGLGDFLFGGNGGGKSANPYASVKFGNSTQRTSDLYDTLDPVWPRGETMFMDVSLPLSKTTHPDPALQLAALTNTTTAGVVWNSGDPSETGDNTEPYFAEEGNPIPDMRPMDITPDLSTLQQHANLSNPKNHIDCVENLEIPQPILTLAIFSAGEYGKAHCKSLNNEKYPNKKGFSGDSDDEFLGMASVDLTTLINGKRPLVDTWLPLQGGTGSVRITCEYETADTPPEKGDLVRFTSFCHPADLYPLVPGRVYPVQDVIDKDTVLLSYTTPEGWICSFTVRRCMLLCVERHHGAVAAAREEFQSITERLSHSPLVGTVTETVDKLPEEGLISVGAGVIQGGAHLLGRWLEGGLDTAVKDVAFATNWDGRFTPGLHAESNRLTENQENSDDNHSINQSQVVGEAASQEESPDEEDPPIILPEPAPSTEKQALPGMPSCPITGEPMIDPVVAADGHSYERAAIARWLTTSDMSPLTGSVMPHKELVPNYGLLSSVQEQANAFRKKAPPSAPKPARKPAPEVKAAPESTATVAPATGTPTAEAAAPKRAPKGEASPESTATITPKTAAPMTEAEIVAETATATPSSAIASKSEVAGGAEAERKPDAIIAGTVSEGITAGVQLAFCVDEELQTDGEEKKDEPVNSVGLPNDS